ncbi:MAG: VWA domain-containing protein [Acidobacteria bacterium]|nr:VWA domain-containing protein [Acidobacteriota bacterium]
MKLVLRTSLAAMAIVLLAALHLPAQSRHNIKGTDADNEVLTVTAARTDNKTDPIKLESLYLYENGFEQKIKNFVVDPSPSRIVILVDNSETLGTSVEKMKAAAMEFAYEIYDGDQLFVVAYDEKPAIIQEWTDDPKKMERSFGLFRKKGNPNLFDALAVTVNEVLLPLMPGTRKTAIVVISDGLDRGSKTKFNDVLALLQKNNVTLYSLQIDDRTSGAYRRDQPKAPQVITRLAEETGGQVFDFKEPQTAAKAICDELRKNRYLLSYVPSDIASLDARRLLLTAGEGVTIRTKAVQPATVK